MAPGRKVQPTDSTQIRAANLYRAAGTLPGYVLPQRAYQLRATPNGLAANSRCEFVWSRCGRARIGQQYTGLVRDLSRMLSPVAPHQNLLCARGGGQPSGGSEELSIPQPASLPAPFSQGSLSLLCNIAQHHRQKPVVSKCALQ